MVAQGLRVALLPALSVLPELDRVAVGVIEGADVVRGISVAWLEGHPLSTDARIVRRALVMAGRARALSQMSDYALVSLADAR